MTTTDQEYVDYARDCARLAGLVQDQQMRDKLLDMACEWMAVAMHETKTPSLSRCTRSSPTLAIPLNVTLITPRRSRAKVGVEPMNTDDLRIEAWAGSQHVSTRPHGIKITHIPSGIEACLDFRESQFANRVVAIDMIKTAVTHPRFREAQDAGRR